MKKLNLILILLFFLILGCNTIPKSYHLVAGAFNIFEKEECAETILHIKKKWALHKDFHCFYYDKPTANKIVESESCFIGRTRDELISLFGKPNANLKNVMIYNMAKECKSGYSIVAEYEFHFYVSDDVVSYLTFNKARIFE